MSLRVPRVPSVPIHHKSRSYPMSRTPRWRMVRRSNLVHWQPFSHSFGDPTCWRNIHIRPDETVDETADSRIVGWLPIIWQNSYENIDFKLMTGFEAHVLHSSVGLSYSSWTHVKISETKVEWTGSSQLFWVQRIAGQKSTEESLQVSILMFQNPLMQ